jgi:polyketide cyclase/dehydrase/lipid transport protein
MRLAIWIVVALAVIAGLVALIGAQLPEAHTVTRTLPVKLPPDALYTLLSDVDNYPTWRPDVKKLDRLPDRDGRPAWVEEMSSGRIPLFFERMDRPSLLVARISDPSLPFGGTWTYRITPAAGGSELSITEDGEVYNPIFRFMSRFVFGQTATMDAFLKHLRARLGEGSAPR